MGWHVFKKSNEMLALVMAISVFAVALLLQSNSSATLNAGAYSYTLEKAISPSEREKGLGHRERLATSQGMVFVFEAPDKACFWMKDMRFSLDIIWLDKKKRVIYIEKNVPPSSYPDLFCPPKPASFVIELNAGEAQSSGLKIGQNLDLSL